MVQRAKVLGLSLAASLPCACLLGNPDFDGTSGSGTAAATSAASSLSSGSSATTTGPGSSSSTSIGLSGSASGGSTGDGSTGETGLTTGGGTTQAPPPEPEHLVHHAGNCADPMWCFYNPDYHSGAPARTSSQECFTATTPAPFQLVRVRFHVAELFGSVDPHLQVRADDGKGTGVLIADLPVAQVQGGDNDLMVEPPVTIGQPSFCVGLAGGSQFNPEGGLGVGVDPTTLMPGQSYCTIDGPGGCMYPNWLDLAKGTLVPPGTWCIDAYVAPLP